MSKHSTATSPVSAFMRKLWAAEEEHPVFAGSLNNIKLLVTVEDSKAKPAATRSKPRGKASAGRAK